MRSCWHQRRTYSPRLKLVASRRAAAVFPGPPASAACDSSSFRGCQRGPARVAGRAAASISAAHAVSPHASPALAQPRHTAVPAGSDVAGATSVGNDGAELDDDPHLPRSPAQLRKAKAILQNAITTAVVDFSRRDDPQTAASTQFVIITEQMPLDRAAAEGWLEKLVPAADLKVLLELRLLLALTITDTAKVLILCPQLLNLPGRDLCVRLMGLRTALPGTDVPVLVRRRPQLLLDEDAVSKAERALKRLKALMPAYDVEALLSEGGETWYNFRSML